MAITVNGVEFSVHTGRKHDFVVKCSNCGREQIFSTNKDDITSCAKLCAGCGHRFRIQGKIVKEVRKGIQVTDTG